MKTNETTITTMNLVNGLSAIGVDVSTVNVDRARAALKKAGAVSDNLTAEVAVSAYTVQTELKKSDTAITKVSKVMGALRLAETWKDAKDDAGNAFKSENAFLKALFPGYATSTLSVYADVGATVYIPALRGDYPDMPELAEMNPNTAKYLLAALKDETKRAALPAALKEASKGGVLTKKAVQDAARAVSGKANSEAKAGELRDGKAAAVADELKGGGVSATVRSLIQFDLNGDGHGDGDLCALVLEKNRKDFEGLLKQGIEKPAMAAAILSAMLESIKAAK